MQERRGGQSCAGGRLHLVPNGRLPKVVSDARSSSYAGACASAWTCSHPCEGASARSSDAPQPVEALLEPEQPRDWVRLSVRDLDVGDVPPREGPLDVGAACATGMRTSAPGREAVEDHGGIRGGHGAHLRAHRLALSVGEAVEGACVQHEAEAGADARVPQRRYVAMDEADLDACFVHALLGATQRLLDIVDAGHLPAPLRQLDAPNTAARAKVEGRSVGRSVSVLLASDQVAELVGKGRVVGEVLPGVEPERVGEPVVHEALPISTPAASRFLITTGIVSPRISVGLNSTISAPA